MNVLSLFDGMSCGQIALERAGLHVESYYASEVDKWAIKITQKNYPDTIQLGDVNDWRNWYLPKIDLLLGGSPCFVKGTKIVCKDGYKNIEDVSVGDFVWTHLGRFKRVIRVGSQIIETVMLNAQGIKPTETTLNHPYYVREMQYVWDNTKRSSVRIFSCPKWKKAANLNTNDFVGVPIISYAENPHNLTGDDCWLIGRYIADGHIRKWKRKNRKNSYQYQVVYSIGEKKLDEFKLNVKRKFSCYPHSQSTYRCVVNSKEFLELLECLNVGKGAENKKIPMCLLLLPKNLLARVIDGYMSGDGSERNGVFKATSVSEELIMTLSLAVAKVYNTNSSYEYTPRPSEYIIQGRLVNQKDTYTTTFRKDDGNGKRSVTIRDIVWLPVKSVLPTNKKEIVHNLEVEDDNSYVANNCVVHNCQSFSIAGKRLNWDDPRGQLFFRYVDCLRYYKPKYFLFENVARMRKDVQDAISFELGVEPIRINSALVSAQNRDRLYWTNIPNVSQPEDRGIILQDTLLDGQHDRLKSYCIDASYFKGGNPKSYFEKNRRQLVFSYGKKKGFTRVLDKAHPLQASDYKSGSRLNRNQDQNAVVTCKRIGSDNSIKGHDYNRRVYSPFGKSPTLPTMSGGNLEPKVAVDEYYYRKLLPIECERLQTVPDGYTEGISNTQRYKMLGNGWTVDVIVHILKNIGHEKTPT